MSEEAQSKQTAIAEVRNEMATGPAGLKQRQEKTRALEQGMMQNSSLEGLG